MNGDALAFMKVCDLHGRNYAPNSYDNYKTLWPDQPLIGSETASATTDRGMYYDDHTNAYEAGYDVDHPSWGNTASGAWVPIEKRDFMAGGFIWTGFDYKGEPTPY